MYYSFFTIYILAGILIALPAIHWALKNGQFKEQQRARFLPLEYEMDAKPSSLSRISRYETYILGGLVGAGLLASGAVLVFSLLADGLF